MISNPDGRNAASLVNLGAAVGSNPIFGLAVPEPSTALVSVWNQVRAAARDERGPLSSVDRRNLKEPTAPL